MRRLQGDQWAYTAGIIAIVIRASEGAMLLVDWDTTLFAPRERDLRMVLDEDLTGWDDYVAVFGDASLNERALELYRRW